MQSPTLILDFLSSEVRPPKRFWRRRVLLTKEDGPWTSCRAVVGRRRVDFELWTPARDLSELDSRLLCTARSMHASARSSARSRHQKTPDSIGSARSHAQFTLSALLPHRSLKFEEWSLEFSSEAYQFPGLTHLNSTEPNRTQNSPL